METPNVMLAQLNLEKNKDVDTLQQKLTTIGFQVRKIICCFGASNWSNTKAPECNKFLQASLAPFMLALDLNKTKQVFSQAQITSEDQARLTHAFNAIEKSQKLGTTFANIPTTELQKYFQPYNENKRLAVNPKIIHITLQCFKNFTLTSKQIETLYPYPIADIESIIASILWEWITQAHNRKTFLKGKEEAIATGVYYIIGKQAESTAPGIRQKIIESIEHDVRHSAFYFGTGNCQIMAETAFLLAILKLMNCGPIRYMQFFHKTQNIDVLNAIVVGEWPKLGCMILAPWYSEKPFTWQGNFEHTQELNQYNTHHTFFTVKNEKERKHWCDYLAKLEFDPTKLLKNQNRENYTAYTKKVSKTIYNDIQEILEKRKQAENTPQPQ